MSINLLDTVVLNHDIPEYKLKTGDIGTVVERYDDTHIEVEFVTGSGKTQALLTLPIDAVHPLGDEEILSARKVEAA